MNADFHIATLPEPPAQDFKSGIWLVLMHIHRVPPHVGMVIGGNYNSLTVKGAECNVSMEALLKTIRQKKIAAVLLRVTGHPVFSPAYQLELLQHQLQVCDRVGHDQNTCLTPVKEFFAELYGLPLLNDELLHGFIDRLHGNGFVEGMVPFNFTGEAGILKLPRYTYDELQQRIREAHLPFYTG